MAYVPDNLCMISDNVGGLAPRMFTYLNTTPDSDATIVGAGYFSDGQLKGMRVGDTLDCVNVTGGAKYKKYQVTAVGTPAGAATVSTPTPVT